MKAAIWFLTLFSIVGMAATPPYDELADAKAAIQHALTAARGRHVPVLIIFGANWCEDCVALDRSLHNGQNAALVAKAFTLVKVDVGNFDRNLEITASYGDPIRKGIPAAVVVSPDNKVLYMTKAGELADARRMSDTGIYEFFARVSQGVTSPR
ncbi:MAG: thioredoxin family protein [Pseudomonadota bacterium]